MTVDIANTFKAGLCGGRPLVGLWQALTSPVTAEICAGAGFDWLLFDGEHGPNTLTTLFAQLQAVAPYSVSPVARPPVGDAHVIKQYLDLGFQTLLVPFVESATQAEALVRSMRYAPQGIRGIGAGLARAARWNGIPGYLDRANDEMCLLVQIESEAGLAKLDAIAEVEGVDGVFIGPADLSAALGHRGRPDHPDVERAIDGALARIHANGKAAGILAVGTDLARRRLAQGFSFVAVGTDVGLLSNGARELARAIGPEKAPVAVAAASPY